MIYVTPLHDTRMGFMLKFVSKHIKPVKPRKDRNYDKRYDYKPYGILLCQIFELVLDYKNCPYKDKDFKVFLDDLRAALALYNIVYYEEDNEDDRQVHKVHGKLIYRWIRGVKFSSAAEFILATISAELDSFRYMSPDYEPRMNYL